MITTVYKILTSILINNYKLLILMQILPLMVGMCRQIGMNPSTKIKTHYSKIYRVLSKVSYIISCYTLCLTIVKSN